MRTRLSARILAATASVALAAGITAGVAGETTAAAAPTPAQAASTRASTTDVRRLGSGAIVSGMPISRKTTRPGAGKTAGYECTVGLPATKGNAYYVIVAGHCGQRGETLYTAWNNGKRQPIGVITGVSATYDIAAVRTTRAAAESVWATRSGTNKKVAITGVAEAVPGAKVCQHGYRSGTVCGITTQPITSKQKAAGLVYGHAARGTMAARPGDSGGLVLDSKRRAIGIVSESTPDGEWMAWVPASLALKNWGLQAL